MGGTVESPSFKDEFLALQSLIMRYEQDHPNSEDEEVLENDSHVAGSRDGPTSTTEPSDLYASRSLRDVHLQWSDLEGEICAFESLVLKPGDPSALPLSDKNGDEELEKGRIGLGGSLEHNQNRMTCFGDEDPPSAEDVVITYNVEATPTEVPPPASSQSEVPSQVADAANMTEANSSAENSEKEAQRECSKARGLQSDTQREEVGPESKPTAMLTGKDTAPLESKVTLADSGKAADCSQSAEYFVTLQAMIAKYELGQLIAGDNAAKTGVVTPREEACDGKSTIVNVGKKDEKWREPGSLDEASPLQPKILESEEQSGNKRAAHYERQVPLVNHAQVENCKSNSGQGGQGPETEPFNQPCDAGSVSAASKTLPCNVESVTRGSLGSCTRQQTVDQPILTICVEGVKGDDTPNPQLDRSFASDFVRAPEKDSALGESETGEDVGCVSQRQERVACPRAETYPIAWPKCV